MSNPVNVQTEFCSICNANPCNALGERFGTCPACHKSDGCINIGKAHWFFCTTHKMTWFVGENLFSGCMFENPEQQRAQQEAVGIAEFSEVEPHYAVEQDAEYEDVERGCHCATCEAWRAEGVQEVEFRDPALMHASTEDMIIDRYLDSYDPDLRWLCRKLQLAPAETVKRILRYAAADDWGLSDAEAEYHKREAATLTAEGWEPGTPPAEPLSKAQVLTLLDHILDVDVSIESTWCRFDMAHRMGQSQEVMTKLLIDGIVSRVLRKLRFLYKDRLNIQEVKEVVMNCEWMRGYHPFRGFTIRYMQWLLKADRGFQNPESERNCDVVAMSVYHYPTASSSNAATSISDEWGA